MDKAIALDKAPVAFDKATALETASSFDLDVRTTSLDFDIHYVHVDSKNRDMRVYPNGNNYVLHFVTPVK